MTAKDEKIFEIMKEKKTDCDTAELLFRDELEEMYPEIENPDVREEIYEGEKMIKGQSSNLVFTQRYAAEELQGLIGFTVADIMDEDEESAICLVLENDHHVRIDLLIPADGLAYASGFYAVDRDGKRI